MERSNPEFLVADFAVLDAGVVWISTTLAYSTNGLVARKARPALATIDRTRRIFMVAFRAYNRGSQPVAAFLAEIGCL